MNRRQGNVNIQHFDVRNIFLFTNDQMKDNGDYQDVEHFRHSCISDTVLDAESTAFVFIVRAPIKDVVFLKKNSLIFLIAKMEESKYVEWDNYFKTHNLF